MNTTSAAEVIPLSIGEHAYHLIRSDILFGRIEPGARLRLDPMKAEYGVGIGTLREILSRLAAEGLVLAEGQRGFEVPPVTAQNLRELASCGSCSRATRWRCPSPRATSSGRGGSSRRTTSSRRPSG